MADAPRAEEERVDEVGVGGRADLERLAAVEEEGDVEAEGGALVAEGEELRDEVL